MSLSLALILVAPAGEFYHPDGDRVSAQGNKKKPQKNSHPPEGLLEKRAGPPHNGPDQKAQNQCGRASDKIIRAGRSSEKFPDAPDKPVAHPSLLKRAKVLLSDAVPRTAKWTKAHGTPFSGFYPAKNCKKQNQSHLYHFET